METTNNQYVIVKEIYNDNEKQREFHAIIAGQIVYEESSEYISDPDEKQTIINALNHMESMYPDIHVLINSANKIMVVKFDESTYTFAQLISDISTHFGYHGFHLYEHPAQNLANIDEILSILKNKENMTGPYEINNDE